MPRCSAAGLGFRIIPAGFNAPLEFLTGFTVIPAQAGIQEAGFEIDWIPASLPTAGRCRNDKLVLPFYFTVF